MNASPNAAPRVDYLLTLANVGTNVPWRQLLETARGRAVQMDRLGFDGVWLGEHHFDLDSTDACPNPVMLAADLAARTERLRLCMGAVTLTTWHPLRLAEDLAMLDHFCDGRLDVAFSRGILPTEINNLNPDADRANPERSKAIFAENLEIIKRAWGSEKFNWNGNRYTIPQPGLKYRPAPSAPRREGFANENGDLINLSLVPRPLQQPMPRLWATTEGVDGFSGAARMGIGGITWYPTGRHLTEMLEAYRSARAEVEGTMPALGEHCALLRMAFVAPTDAEARELYETGLTEHVEFINTVRGKGVWFDTGENPDDPIHAGVKPFDLLMERDHLLVGSPDTVAARMRRMMSTHGIRHWLVSMGMSGIDPKAVNRSLELFAKEVIPSLK